MAESCDLVGMARSVVVESISADFAFNNRIAYRVRLSCGCSYWEYRPIGTAPPKKGRSEACHAAHQTDSGGRSMTALRLGTHLWT